MLQTIPTIATISPVPEGWLVRSPTGPEVVVEDLSKARYQLAKLLDPDNWYETARNLTLIDGYGQVVQDITVFLDGNNDEARCAVVAAQPPEGCRWYPEGPGLHFLSHEANRWDAIAVLARELREQYGVTVDLGYDKNEWDGEPDRIAHLLLNAVNRAKAGGVAEHGLMRFITAVLGGTVTTSMGPGNYYATAYRIP